MTDWVMPKGDNRIMQRADRAEIEFDGTLVWTMFALRYHLDQGPLGPLQHTRGNTIAVSMDLKTAVELGAKLLEMGQREGLIALPER